MYILQSLRYAFPTYTSSHPNEFSQKKKKQSIYTRTVTLLAMEVFQNLIIAHTSTNWPGAPKNYSAPKRHRWNASKGKKKFQLRREKSSFFWTITHDHAHATSCSTTAHDPPGHSQPHTSPYRPARAAAAPPPSYGSTPSAGPHAPHPCRRAKWPRNGN